MLKRGETIAHYRIGDKLGRGTTGVVYQAVDDENRQVALKLLSAELVTDDDACHRFLREAQTLIPLRHRNLVGVIECGLHEGAPYLVMELLSGATLRDHVRTQDRLSVTASLDIVMQLCDGLQYAHDHGIVHRDVKPANVWLLPNGAVKLLDFGLAHIAGSTLTRTGDVLGSVAYMAPEQLGGPVIDGRVDIFAAGVVLFELLSGRRPYEGDNIAAIMEAILHEPTPDLRTLVPGLAEDIYAAISTALEKDPDERYGHAMDFAADLRLARYVVEQPAAVHVASHKPIELDGELTETMIAPRPAVVLESRDIAASSLPRNHQESAVTPGLPPEAAAVVSTVDVDEVPSRAGAPAETSEATRPPVRSWRSGWEVFRRAVLTSKWLLRDPWAQAIAGTAVVAVLAVAAGSRSRPAPTTAYRLELASVPTGARIEIDGKDSGYRTPAALGLAARPGQVRLLLAGYEETEVSLPTASTAKLALTLHRVLRVSSQPPNAVIVVNGQDTGFHTPATIRLSDPPPDAVELRLGNQRQRLPLTDGVLASGELHVDLGNPRDTKKGPPTVGPTGPTGPRANVAVHIVGGYPFEVSGCGRTSPVASDHTLRVAAPCTLRLRSTVYYLDVTRTIDASSGQVEIAVPPLAKVELRSRFEWCTIVLAGHAIGPPTLDVELASGTYRVDVQCPDRTYVIRALTIEPGRSSRRLDELLR